MGMSAVLVSCRTIKGPLWFSSEPGKGATLSVLFPVAPVPVGSRTGPGDQVDNGADKSPGDAFRHSAGGG